MPTWSKILGSGRPQKHVWSIQLRWSCMDFMRERLSHPNTSLSGAITTLFPRLKWCMRCKERKSFSHRRTLGWQSSGTLYRHVDSRDHEALRKFLFRNGSRVLFLHERRDTTTPDELCTLWHARTRTRRAYMKHAKLWSRCSATADGSVGMTFGGIYIARQAQSM